MALPLRMALGSIGPMGLPRRFSELGERAEVAQHLAAVQAHLAREHSSGRTSLPAWLTG